MKFVPIHGTTLNIGVEQGASAVLDRLQSPYAVTNFDFHTPEQILDTDYIATMLADSESFAELINKTLQSKETQVVIGGDHSVGLASLLALFKRYDPAKVGYIQFDSHADINTLASSPTGNFHGMFLRPFIGDFDNILVTNTVKHKLPVRNVMYIGNLELDPEEAEFIAQNKIVHIDRTQILSDTERVQRVIKEFIARFDHVHVSFDIDVFDKSIVTATGTQSQDGLFPKDVFPLLLEFQHCSSISFDLVEVNPLKEGIKETLELARDVLTYFILF